jgi:regulator of sigma E protease
MSYVLALAGFAALIILHEAGHFVAAKAVGMRVERFALFFPPLIFKRRRGETEYGIGAIPLGGYVKITGMNPHEEIPPEVAPRAYFRQPVWKRIVVIAAGPAVNLVVAFLLVFGIYAIKGQPIQSPANAVAAVSPGTPAAGALRPGDRILSVDGSRSDPATIAKAISSHHCAGTPVQGCVATTPARVTILRDARRETLALYPVYDTTVQPSRTRLGFEFGGTTYKPVSVFHAASLGASQLWTWTSATASAMAKIFQARERRQLSGVVGLYTVTQEAFSFDVAFALELLALISLALALFNLFPFLPLDGGHIFWALVEKVRGRAVPFVVMERASVVGIMLVLLLAVIGFSNDINHLANGGFGIR